MRPKAYSQIQALAFEFISPSLSNCSENNVRCEFKNEILELRPLHGILHGNIKSRQKN